MLSGRSYALLLPLSRPLRGAQSTGPVAVGAERSSAPGAAAGPSQQVSGVPLDAAYPRCLLRADPARGRAAGPRVFALARHPDDRALPVRGAAALVGHLPAAGAVEFPGGGPGRSTAG